MDASTFTTFVDTHSTAAQRVAQHLLGDPEAAADAVQDGFVKAYRAWSRCQGGNPRAWLLRIVTNTCYDHLAYQKRRPETSLDALLEDQGEAPLRNMQQSVPSPDEHWHRREIWEILMGALAELPPAHRYVLQRIDMEGYSYAEVMAEAQLPMGTVKSRLYRARQQMRDQLVAVGLIPAARMHRTR